MPIWQENQLVYTYTVFQTVFQSDLSSQVNPIANLIF